MKKTDDTSFVYILGSDGIGGRLTYVGWTTDLERRLDEHNTGKGALSTKGRSWSLLYAERYINRGEAMSREWYLKKDRKFRKGVHQE
ncbi:MAG: GIY-YIG nuclease family protein [Magnetococcales bacterium]|nr:GIY-YIG nuclease family protein [Magnetococcales bacterium]